MPEIRHLKGWKRDIKDVRDFKYRSLFTLPRAQLPKSVDLRNLCSPVEQQGGVGSCTANAVVGAMEYLKRDRLNRKVLCMRVIRDLSRLFVYWNTRAIENTIDVDCGASIRNAIKALASNGTCYEKSWPYQEDAWAKKPDEKCYKEALDYKIVSYYRVENMDEALNALAQKLPVAFGAMLFESFSEAEKTATVDLPAEGERAIGGHAMLIVGYDQEKEEFIVRNSWGTGWGDQGYCYMPFAYCTFGGRVDDFWVVKG
jgi:C1A family cysteine protease